MKPVQNRMKKFLTVIVIVVVVCFGCAESPMAAVTQAATRPAKAKRPAISLTNYTNGTTIRYPVPLIRGKLADANATSIKVINTSSNRNTRQMEGLAYEGNFKVLTELVPGNNKLIIRAGRGELALTLNYKPQTNPYVVRVFYLTDKIGNTEYQTPIENDLQDYRGKLETAMKLMQTFCAERMNDLGFGRVSPASCRT
jgi:hypothetical protein